MPSLLSNKSLSDTNLHSQSSLIIVLYCNFAYMYLCTVSDRLLRQLSRLETAIFCSHTCTLVEVASSIPNTTVTWLDDRSLQINGIKQLIPIASLKALKHSSPTFHYHYSRHSVQIRILPRTVNCDNIVI